MGALPAARAERIGSCHGDISFQQYLSRLKDDAIARGISSDTLFAAAPAMVFDEQIVRLDRSQHFFGQSFFEFAAQLVTPQRLKRAQSVIRTYGDVFRRAEHQYGVPPAVVAAFWGLESNFGDTVGNAPILRSLVSLAYDCRRSDMFRRETLAALEIVERGDLTTDELVGSWAGELGQTQFLPTHYVNYAIDYDGDGRRNLLRSVPDVIGSTANYIATGLKWRRGEPWIEEVRVTQDVPWDQAELGIRLPRSKWTLSGVSYPDERPLPNDDLSASLLLPMGRFGPAFLAYPNFDIYTQWNNSLVYSITAAYLAARIAGAPAMRPPAGPVAQLSMTQLRELQRLLVREGFSVGNIDGVLGQQSRRAVKAMQLRFGLPADSWPTAELLARMRSTTNVDQPSPSPR